MGSRVYPIDLVGLSLCLWFLSLVVFASGKRRSITTAAMTMAAISSLLNFRGPFDRLSFLGIKKQGARTAI